MDLQLWQWVMDRRSGVTDHHQREVVACPRCASYQLMTTSLRTPSARMRWAKALATCRSLAMISRVRRLAGVVDVLLVLQQERVDLAAGDRLHAWVQPAGSQKLEALSRNLACRTAG